MSALERVIDRLAQRLGGPRILALPLIRLLAVVSGYVWVLLAPSPWAGWDAVDTTMLGFLLYSLLVIGLLWWKPAPTLRARSLVLVLDLAFALLLIHLTGGARSTLFLALLLIAGLQAYYYGLRRGLLVAAGAGAAYLILVWPTIRDMESANMAIRLTVLLGTAIGVGLLAEVEERERGQVVALSRQAREREQFIHSVVESLSEGLIVLDPEGRVVTWNRAMAERYGIPAAEALGRPFFELNPALEHEALAGPLRALLRGERETFVIEGMAHRSLRRGPVTQNLTGTLLRRGGRPAGAVLLVQDITEQVRLERAARQADKLAALGTLSAGLAHELNNPIGIISSRIELMLLETDAALPPGLREDLTVLHRHAQRVARIVQGLLSFARQSGGVQQAVDLNQVVEATALLVEKQITKDGLVLRRRLTAGLPPIQGDPTGLQQVLMNLVLRRRLTAGLPPIQGDPTGLQQVLMNLVLNAREAMAGGGEIEITTDAAPGRPDHVRLIVRDTGPGISPEVLPRIFDPFFTTKATGTGLGLSISYGIVREHQGTVDVQTAPGQGTTFILTFPARPVEAPV